MILKIKKNLKNYSNIFLNKNFILKGILFNIHNHNIIVFTT